MRKLIITSAAAALVAGTALADGRILVRDQNTGGWVDFAEYAAATGAPPAAGVADVEGVLTADEILDGVDLDEPGSIGWRDPAKRHMIIVAPEGDVLIEAD